MSSMFCPLINLILQDAKVQKNAKNTRLIRVKIRNFSSVKDLFFRKKEIRHDKSCGSQHVARVPHHRVPHRLLLQFRHSSNPGVRCAFLQRDLRLKRAWTRLDLLYEETEELFKRVKATKDICELRNMINVGYLITRQAMERKESRGLHYTIDYPKHAYDQK